MKIVRIPTAGGRKIEGTLFLPTGGCRRHPAALFLHGWGSDRQRQLRPAELLSALGFVALAIDLRGHGKTGKLVQSVSAADNLRDAIAAYDYLVSRKDVDENCMGIAGFSYGGFLAILVSEERKLQWLALRSPALYRNGDLRIPKAKIKRRGLMAFRRRELVPADNVGLRAAAKLQGHVLIIEAEHDRVVPHQQIRNYLNALRSANSIAHRVIRGADHAMSRDEWYQEAVDSFVRWLKKCRIT